MKCLHVRENYELAHAVYATRGENGTSVLKVVY